MELTPEQFALLKQRVEKLPPEKLKELQKQQCPFCLMSLDKIPAKKIYNDNKVIAVLDINPATKGHAIIFPKKHYSSLAVIPQDELTHLFLIVNKLNEILTKVLEAEGTNIFIANGEIAGQKIDHILVHIIPRYTGDEIDFTWKTKKISNEELDEIQKKIFKSLEKIIVKKTPEKEEKIDKKILEKFIKKEERIA